MIWLAVCRTASKIWTTPPSQIEIAFEIAQNYNADVDMHIDETDDPYWHSLELLAEKTHRNRLAGPCHGRSLLRDVGLG